MAYDLHTGRCSNREPYVDSYDVQDGWHEDGRRRMMRIENINSKSCKFDLRDTQPGCQNCRWQHVDDLRDHVQVASA